MWISHNLEGTEVKRWPPAKVVQSDMTRCWLTALGVSCMHHESPYIFKTSFLCVMLVVMNIVFCMILSKYYFISKCTKIGL